MQPQPPQAASPWARLCRRSCSNRSKVALSFSAAAKAKRVSSPSRRGRNDSQQSCRSRKNMATQRGNLSCTVSGLALALRFAGVMAASPALGRFALPHFRTTLPPTPMILPTLARVRLRFIPRAQRYFVSAGICRQSCIVLAPTQTPCRVLWSRSRPHTAAAMVGETFPTTFNSKDVHMHRTRCNKRVTQPAAKEGSYQSDELTIAMDVASVRWDMYLIQFANSNGDPARPAPCCNRRRGNHYKPTCYSRLGSTPRLICYYYLLSRLGSTPRPICYYYLLSRLGSAPRPAE